MLADGCPQIWLCHLNAAYSAACWRWRLPSVAWGNASAAGGAVKSIPLLSCISTAARPSTAASCWLPAGATEQCCCSPRGCARASWCSTQEHLENVGLHHYRSKLRGRVKESLSTRNGHLNEKNGNQVFEKQQLSCQGRNINHPRDTALCPYLIPLRSKFSLARRWI